MGSELKDVSKMTDTEREIEIGVEANRRAQNCMIDIKNALNRWKCQIEPMVQISGSGIVKGNFMIVPLVERSVA